MSLGYWVVFEEPKMVTFLRVRVTIFTRWVGHRAASPEPECWASVHSSLAPGGQLGLRGAAPPPGGQPRISVSTSPTSLKRTGPLPPHGPTEPVDSYELPRSQRGAHVGISAPGKPKNPGLPAEGRWGEGSDPALAYSSSFVTLYGLQNEV